MSDDKKASSGGSDGGRNGPPEKTDTAKSVSELLAEWEENRSGSDDGKNGADNKDELAQLKKELNELKSAHQAESQGKDFKALLAEIAGDTGAAQAVVRGWVEERAEGDPALIEIFDNRSKKPAQYKELIAALKPEFEGWAKDNIAPRDSGLKAAVRNARETDPAPAGFEGVKWESLSDSEFATKSQEVFRAAEKGQLT